MSEPLHALNVLHATTHKGYPSWAAPMPASAVGTQGWSVLQADWPLPCATLRQSALTHNLNWMQRLVRQAGVDLAPHGKTTLSPELFQAQLQAGAWGITVANVWQLALAVSWGVRRALIANQILLPHDLAWLDRLQQQHPDLRVVCWLDSHAQLHAIVAAQLSTPVRVVIELGLAGGRTGCRDDEQTFKLALATKDCPAIYLQGLACYEGLWASGDDAADAALVCGLMQRLHTIAQACDQAGLFAHAPEILLTAGGSAVFDLVAAQLIPSTGPTGATWSRPVRGLLRSGCYLTHDHGTYQRYMGLIQKRLTQRGLAGQVWSCGGLQAALEVWTVVQSRPESHLAILNAGKRDLSFDVGLPSPQRWLPQGHTELLDCPSGWRITALNDQHAYLDLSAAADADTALSLQVGDRVALGISHPCTTFDKWRWMPTVNDQGDIVGAITTGF